MLLTNTLAIGLHFDTHPQSWYLHLLSFYALDLQLEFLRKFQQPLASFAMQQCEFSNKIKKEAMVSFIILLIGQLGTQKTQHPPGRTRMGI